MKLLKLIHSSLGVMPFVWFMLFLSILMVGTIHLGYIPKYGNHIDPDALNISTLSTIHLISAFFAYLAFYLWILISIIMKYYFKMNFSLNRITTIFFFIGVLGFFVFKFIFKQYFLWVMD